jgi:hypothetical protein
MALYLVGSWSRCPNIVAALRGSGLGLSNPDRHRGPFVIGLSTGTWNCYDMPTIPFRSQGVLYAQTIPEFPWFYNAAATGNENGLSFGASANQPIIGNRSMDTESGPGVPFTIPTMDMSTPFPQEVNTWTVGSAQTFLFASWDHDQVAGTQYGLNFDGQLTYPGDGDWPDGPYTLTVSDIVFSNPTDQAAFLAAIPRANGSHGIPVKGGFLFMPAAYAGTDPVTGNAGPIGLFVAPDASYYNRIIYVGNPADTAAVGWLNDFATIYITNGMDPQISAMFDGENSWLALDSVIGFIDPGHFPLLMVPGSGPSPPPPPPPPALIVPNGPIGPVKNLGPNWLKQCCGLGSLGPIYPTAGGIR